MSESKCRRCSECRDSEHHWMPNPDFGDDWYEDAEHPEAEYICKHCDALGEECRECEGHGSPHGSEDECEQCWGEGIVERQGAE